MNKIKLTKRASQSIKKELKQRGITQEDFAENTLGVTFRTLQNYLSGKTPIPLKGLDSIQDVFCISIVDIFGEVPNGYEKTTTSLFNIFKIVLQINVFNSKTPSSSKKGFNHYAEKLKEQVHVHPYPVEEPFQVLKCDTSTKNNYYCKISIILSESVIPVGAFFTIGYILPSSPVRVRFDYGTLTVKENSFSVDEIFTSVFSRYDVPLDMNTFTQTKCLLKMATWIGDESIIFIIRSSGIAFRIETENSSEEDIYKQEKRGMTIFRRGVWQ